MNGGGRIDKMKFFLLALTVLVVLLGAGILYAAHQVSQYQEAIQSGTDNFKGFFERCFELKQNQDRVAQEKVDLNEPIKYVFPQLDAAEIPRASVNMGKSEIDHSGASKGYEDTKISVDFRDKVKRDKLARFLYNIEANSAILRTYSITLPTAITLPHVAPNDGSSDEWKNVKVVLAYRKPVLKKK